MKLKEALRNQLTKKEISLVPTSFDVIGTIAIFNDFPKQLRRKEKCIAHAVMLSNPHIKTVAKKSGRFAGTFRTQKITIIGGENTKETIHKENNCFIKVDVEKCYFSPRLSTERIRVAKKVKKNKSVLVLFSGVSPYPCVIAKNAQPKEIYAIELNRKAHEYAKNNITLNKLDNIFLYRGDVKKILPKIKKRFDRIIMPLPKNAEKFLTLANNKLKPKGTIHLYSFAHEKDFHSVKRYFKKQYSSVKLTPCGHYSPGVYRICLDLMK
jgi:tRNA (guanine37-N1)-methyltransferase